MQFKKIRPIYNESESLKIFNKFFEKFESFLIKELTSLKSKFQDFEKKKITEALKSEDLLVLYKSLLELKSNFNSSQTKYDIYNSKIDDLETRMDFYFERIKNYFYNQNISFFTTEKEIVNSVHEVGSLLVFKYLFEETLIAFKTKLKKEEIITIDIDNMDFELIYYFVLAYTKVNLDHDLQVTQGQLDYEIEKLAQEKLEVEKVNSKLESITEELINERKKLYQLESINNIVPNLHFQDFIINIDYCDFRPFHSMISEWNLFLYDDGSSVSLTHLIYLFDVTNSEKGLYPLPTNFINSTITIEEFGLFLYQIKSKLLKPSFYGNFEKWYNSHFTVESKHGKSVTDISRYVKPYKKQIENEGITDYLNQFLLAISIKQ
jgi:hypothetical protein